MDKIQKRRGAFIQGLRDMADFFEGHPQVDHPRCNVMNVFINTREEVARHARAASWEKVYNDHWFSLRKEFGYDLTLDVNAGRDTVCRRVVKGTHVVPAQPERIVEDVEWVCDETPLLAEVK